MHKKTVLIFIVLLLLFSFISCTRKPTQNEEEQANENNLFGTWTSETTYENEQLGIKFALDENYKVMNEDEVNDFISPEKMIINGANQAKEDTEGCYQYFDFGLKDSDELTCIVLYYTDIKKETNADISVSGYCDMLMDGFTSYGNKVSKKSVASIAGTSYTKFTAYINDSVYIDYYLRKNGDLIAIWLVGRYEGQSNDPDEFLNNITKL